MAAGERLETGIHMKLRTTKSRSAVMARILSRNTKPELAVRRELWRLGVRYRIHDARVPGRPDLVHGPSRIAVFIDGCFWHGCRKHYAAPRNNAAYWRAKVSYNRNRRRNVLRALRQRGWSPMRFWECEIEGGVAKVAAQIAQTIERRN